MRVRMCGLRDWRPGEDEMMDLGGGNCGSDVAR